MMTLCLNLTFTWELTVLKFWLAETRLHFLILLLDYIFKTLWWFNLLAGLRTHWIMVSKEFGLLDTWRVHAGEFFFLKKVFESNSRVSYLGPWIILIGTAMSNIASIMNYFYLIKNFVFSYISWYLVCFDQSIDAESPFLFILLKN
jgi:hypothetical protein